MIKGLLSSLLFLSSLQGFSQIDKYVVFFRDKHLSPYSLGNPQQYLSNRAIQRRQKQGISLDSSDLPVNPAYVTAVKNNGAFILTRSKWFNSVTVQCDSATASSVNMLSF